MLLEMLTTTPRLYHDSLQVFYTEGKGSVASTLSALSSSDLDEGIMYDDIK